MGKSNGGNRLLFSLTSKDFEMETFSVGGHGGSGKDTSNTGVRLRHPASGAVGEGREERSQLENRKRALVRLANSGEFRRWHRQRCQELLMGRTVEQEVERTMLPENLVVEVRGESGWERAGD